MTITAIKLPMEQIEAFCQRWQVMEFALFGSVLREDFRPDSNFEDMPETLLLFSNTYFFMNFCINGGFWYN